MKPTSLASMALALSAAGCFQTTDMDEVLPDERIQVNLPMDEGLGKAPRDWATWYLFTASTTETINAMAGTVLLWVDGITSNYRPTLVDRDQNTAEWGPWSTALDPVETLLWMSYDPETDIHTWGFDQWPRDAERDAASTVVLGEVDPGASRDLSAGRFQVDFTTVHELDPTEDATGLFDVEYDIHANGVTAAVTFTDFGDDQLDAVYLYDQAFDGDGLMDLAVEADINPESGTGLEETWYTRSRWQPTGAGQADIRITGGDLGDTVATITECWSSSFERVYYVESLSGTEEGDLSECVFGDPDYYEE